MGQEEEGRAAGDRSPRSGIRRQESGDRGPTRLRRVQLTTDKICPHRLAERRSTSHGPSGLGGILSSFDSPGLQPGLASVAPLGPGRCDVVRVVAMQTVFIMERLGRHVLSAPTSRSPHTVAPAPAVPSVDRRSTPPLSLWERAGVRAPMEEREDAATKNAPCPRLPFKAEGKGPGDPFSQLCRVAVREEDFP